MNPPDIQLISAWAARCRGPVIDAGCGPGHWTQLLADLGADVEGVDLVPAFVDLATARFPTVPYRVANLDDLARPDGSVAGILAWYSLIHLEPERVPLVLREFRRCLADDGTLLVGFYESDRLEPFPHTVTEAYSWPVDELSRLVEDAGFGVRHTRTHPNPKRPDRRHGTLLAGAT
ncbi:methyltransferase domain-containing protein [Cellulomonas rhizosphaerae]|uniref:Methyltransferase domain-containing protein n=2 Tax=Cellulomonas rhizosphaerae TaxID=2293719 RepID=A0A413RMN9_9CELL|nr:methyltransferase domain-containing protein [Cellulomonas rhizosphaerae]